MRKLLILITIVFTGLVIWYVVILIRGGNPAYKKTPAVVPPGQLELTDGSTIPIPEFIVKNEASTKLSPEIFRDISGNNISSYRISYLPYNKENSRIEFNILLNSTPLGKVRLEAEQILRAKLGLDNEELCKMDVSVYTLGWVDQAYAGRNLGLSFCKNAVSLP